MKEVVWVCVVITGQYGDSIPSDTQFSRNSRFKFNSKHFANSYVYWTVHHCNSWRI